MTRACRKPGKSGKSGKKRCMRPGPMTNNGYLNFLREFKQQPENCGLSPQETVIRAGRMWCRLKPEQQQCYRDKAANPVKKKRSRSKSKRRGCARPRAPKCKRSKPKKRSGCARRKPAARRPKPRGCAKKERCKRMQGGPITNNGYLNFLRYYRRTVCNLKPTEVIKRGARIWCRMPPEKREKFNIMACEVTTSHRRKCSRLCQMVRRKKLEAAKRKRAQGGGGSKKC